MNLSALQFASRELEPDEFVTSADEQASIQGRVNYRRNGRPRRD